MELTKTQHSAINKIGSFFNSSNNIFILKGAAGTGKTTLCNYIIDIINERDDLNYILLSPTGRAARVLARKTNSIASTVHQHIYKRSNLVEYIETNKKTDLKTTFDLKINDNSLNTIYIIDEASMISNIPSNNNNLLYGTGNLLSDIIKFTFNPMIETNHKLIFIGDQAQLPPINCYTSPALDAEILEKYEVLQKKMVIEEHTLMEIVRQNKMNKILEDAFSLRNQIENDKFVKFSISTNSDNCKELNYYDLENRFVYNYLQDNPNKPIMITHSNAASRYKNEWIRKKIYKPLCDHENCNDIFRCSNLSYLEPNESLISIHNSYKYNILNGDSFTVKEVINQSYEKHEIFKDKNDSTPIELEFVDVIIIKYSIEDKDTIEQTVKVILNSLNSNENSLSKDENNALNVFAAERHRDLYKSKKNNNSKRSKLNIESDPFIKAFFDDVYRNALQIKYGYSITCHKSQGGEWDDAYIDFTYSSTDSNAPLSQDYFRWAYTALTRGKNNVFHVNQNKVKIINEKKSQQSINYKKNNESHGK